MSVQLIYLERRASSMATDYNWLDCFLESEHEYKQWDFVRIRPLENPSFSRFNHNQPLDSILVFCGSKVNMWEAFITSCFELKSVKRVRRWSQDVSNTNIVQAFEANMGQTLNTNMGQTFNTNMEQTQTQIWEKLLKQESISNSSKITACNVHLLSTCEKLWSPPCYLQLSLLDFFQTSFHLSFGRWICESNRS